MAIVAGSGMEETEIFQLAGEGETSSIVCPSILIVGWAKPTKEGITTGAPKESATLPRVA